ncbi:MAG: hypothetical protein JO072_10180 [Parafilimonas sp.]|nr:hypothetical protein [Parafilimonas sp.]
MTSAEQFHLAKQEYINAVTNQLETLNNISFEDLDSVEVRTKLIDLRTKVVFASIQLTSFINSKHRLQAYINKVQALLDKRS